MGRPVIFCVPHPDDETLGAGVAIAEHVAAGRDVHVLLMTKGTSSGAIDKINGSLWSPWWGAPHNPTVEGYQPLDATTLGVARLREIRAALGCLGVAADRLHFAWDLIGTEPLDTQVTVAQAKAAIRALHAQVMADNPNSGNCGLWTPTHLVDNNSDHTNIGKASQQLGAEDPVVWADRRYWVIPPYWNDPRLNQVTGRMWDTPTDAQIANRVRNACRAYAAWGPEQGMYAFGYHSVADMFAAMDGTTSTNQPKCLIHK
ncbi:PIG-L deacetylase family protein [Micromonospora sp. C41]|uniref:PIG-L deacetylase family protein n=1 Tax=Micromonospora sp. C41 TaxID=2824878 RepID=UPI001B393EB5|nr:PIG-L family deacetylase [Micromonospora sp. C41]MBQ1064464.1 PIG-L family deacetylase [Micromonospora sp. C41]